MLDDPTSLKRRVEELEEIHHFGQSLSSIANVPRIAYLLPLVSPTHIRVVVACEAQTELVMIAGICPMIFYDQTHKSTWN